MSKEAQAYTIENVRIHLYNAYKRLEQTPDGIEGKSSEAYVELRYPTYWDCNSLEEFIKPNGIMIYSYALGPSRSHYFYQSDKDEEKNYYTWNCTNIYKTAIETISKWEKMMDSYEEEKED